MENTSKNPTKASCLTVSVAAAALPSQELHGRTAVGGVLYGRLGFVVAGQACVYWLCLRLKKGYSRLQPSKNPSRIGRGSVTGLVITGR